MKEDAISVKVRQLSSGDPLEVFRASLALRLAVERAATGAGRKSVAEALAKEFSARTEGPQPKDKNAKRENRPTHGVETRQRLALLLGLVGGDEEAPVLAAALPDLDVREAARMGLERIPGASATAALIAALDEVGPEFRLGVIGALAKRRVHEVAAALRKAAGESTDAEVRSAALGALALFPDAASDPLMSAAAQAGPPRQRECAQRARIQLAETLAKAGDKRSAAAIYHSIASGNAGPAQKKAAAIGMKQLG